MLEKIIVTLPAASLPSEVEVCEAESKLGTLFPKGYGQFIMQFGEGVLGGGYIRIYPPARILMDLEGWRERINEYWFQDEGCDVLSKTDALNSFILGDTVDGDELIFHPDHPNRIYVLPRYSESIFIAGDGLEEAIEWLCTSGVLTEPFEERNFEAFHL